MRPAHILRKTGKTGGYPRMVISFDTETHPDPRDVKHASDDRRQCLTLGYAHFSDFGTVGKRTTGRGRYKDAVCYFKQADEFWDFVESKTQPKMKLTVVGHNAKNFDLSVLKFEMQLRQRGWVIDAEKMTIPDPNGPFRIEARKGNRTIVLCDLSNWYGMLPLKKIGMSLKMFKGEVNAADSKYWPMNGCKPNTPDWRDLKKYCKQDSAIVLHAMKVWAEFCEKYDMGPHAMTNAGQALNAYRHRFMPHDIHLHNDGTATDLERNSYLGARTEAFIVGTFKAPNPTEFKKLDINSMYPYVMSVNKYPTKLLRTEQGRNIGRDLASATKTSPKVRRSYVRGLIDAGYGVVAEVHIDTTRSTLHEDKAACVPDVFEGKLTYRRGTFNATVTTRELLRAIKRGIIVDVLRIAVYEMEYIFKQWVDEMYKLRKTLEADGNGSYAALVKNLLNSLYGKFGQRNFRWDKSDVPLDGKAGLASFRDLQTGERYHLRKLGTETQRRSETKIEGQNSFPAIAAHITADARLLINEYREKAGIEFVWYMDTDSLFTNTSGYKKLQEMNVIDQKRLGALKLEEETDYMVINAPKDYTFGTTTKLKGVKGNAVYDAQEGTYTQDKFRSLAGAMRQRDVNRVIISKTKKRIAHTNTKREVLPGGRTRPLVAQDRRPILQ